MYLDLLIIVNLGMNFSILVMVARLSQRTVNGWRVFFASLGGSIPVVIAAAFQAGFPVWSIMLLTTPFFMAGVAFYPVKARDLFYLGGAVFLVAFLLGGAVLALIGTQGPGFERMGIAPLLLMVSLLGYGAVSLFKPYLEDKKWQKLLRARLLISLEGREQIIKAFLDTGNRVREPFLKKPVIIVDYRGLRGVLPPNIYKIIQDCNLDPVQVLGSIEPREALRFHLIPLVGFSGESEMLLGFRPDAIKVLHGKRSWEVGSRVVLGLRQRTFGSSEEFQALMPPEVLQLVG